MRTRGRGRFRVRLGALCLAVVLIAAALTACGTRDRATLAQSAATGAVAAIARGDVIELSSRLRHTVNATELASLQREVPAGIGNDPIMYSASVDLSSGADAVDVVVTRTAPPSDLRFSVLLSWDAARRDWRVGKVTRMSGN